MRYVAADIRHNTCCQIWEQINVQVTNMGSGYIHHTDKATVYPIEYALGFIVPGFVLVILWFFLLWIYLFYAFIPFFRLFSIMTMSHECQVLSKHRPFDCLFDSLLKQTTKKDWSSDYRSFIRGIHWCLVVSLTKYLLYRKHLHFHDISISLILGQLCVILCTDK